MRKVNNKNFRKAMSKYATGITIISINYDNNFIGKTVNSFSALSLNPSLVLFSLDKSSSSLLKFKKSNYLGINFLSKKQRKLSDYFSKKNNSWGSTNYFLSDMNIPLLQNSLANFECRNIKTISSGDHFIFICKVLKLKINEHLKPLIYVNNRYN